MRELEKTIMQIGAGDPSEGPFLGFKEPLQKINKIHKELLWCDFMHDLSKLWAFLMTTAHMDFHMVYGTHMPLWLHHGQARTLHYKKKSPVTFHPLFVLSSIIKEIQRHPHGKRSKGRTSQITFVFVFLQVF